MSNIHCPAKWALTAVWGPQKTSFSTVDATASVRSHHYQQRTILLKISAIRAVEASKPEKSKKKNQTEISHAASLSSRGLFSLYLAPPMASPFFDATKQSRLVFGQTETELIVEVLRASDDDIHYTEPKQQDKYINRARYEFLLYNPAMCGVELLSRVSSNWLVVVDTRSVGLVLPAFLYDIVLAQLDLVHVLDCGSTYNSDGGGGSGGGSDVSSYSDSGDYYSGGGGEGPENNIPVADQGASFCRFRDANLTDAQLAAGLPTLTFALSDRNFTAAGGSLGFGSRAAANLEEEKRLALPLSRLVLRANGVVYLALSKAEDVVLSDAHDTDGTEQVMDGHFTADMSKSHIGFGSLVLSAFDGVVFDNPRDRLGFIVAPAGPAGIPAGIHAVATSRRASSEEAARDSASPRSKPREEEEAFSTSVGSRAAPLFAQVEAPSFCSVPVQCAYATQVYDALLNRCVDPDCGAYLGLVLDEGTRTCVWSPFLPVGFVLAVVVLAVVELWSYKFYVGLVRRAAVAVGPVGPADTASVG